MSLRVRTVFIESPIDSKPQASLYPIKKVNDILLSLGIGSTTEATDLFSFELESNGIPTDLMNITDSSLLDVDCWFDLIDTSDTSGELNDIQLSPIPKTASELEPVQPVVDKSRLIRPDIDVSTSVPYPTPSLIFPTNGRPEIRKERKSLLSVRLKLPNNADCDNGDDDDDDDVSKECVDFELNLTDDHSNEELSDPDSKDFLEEADCASFMRLRTGSVLCPKKCLHNEDIINGKPGQRLQLSAEETKMLRAMGIQMPSRFPLSRTEERALRTVRRKIRNKISAQASRARRQEYVTDLEYRVQLSDRENERLRRQVAHLQNDKRDLIAHVRRLRSYVAKFLYKDEKSTPLPLFTHSAHKSNHSIKSAKQAATAAAGGTSLLIVTFLILGWTAPVLVSPSKNIPSPELSAVRPNSVFSYFPGRSRNLLESSSPNDLVGTPIGKPKVTSTEHTDGEGSVLRKILNPLMTKITDRASSVVTLKDSSVKEHETNGSVREANSNNRADTRGVKEIRGIGIHGDPSDADALSASASSIIFPSTLDL